MLCSELLSTAALVAFAWSLCVRRRNPAEDWSDAAAVLFLGTGVVVHPIGRVGNFISHLLMIACAVTILQAVIRRFGSDEDFLLRFRQHIALPFAIILPTMAVAFFAGWMLLYWLLLCGSLIYAFVYAMRGLVILRWHLPGRARIDLMIFACGCAVVACVVYPIIPWGVGVFMFASAMAFALTASRVGVAKVPGQERAY